jgi:hypothetical protein
MGLFTRLFRARPNQDAPIGAHTLPLASSSMAWRADATFPIPDWDRVEPPLDADLDAFWRSAARAWLDGLASSLSSRSPSYELAESPNFMLLAALPRPGQRLVLHGAEASRKRLLEALKGVARDDGYGKTIILVLDSQQTYYDYVSNYYGGEPDDGELSLSSGMFIDDGYGHFAFVANDDMRSLDPTITHELTHALVRHLPLPAWLNEGIAVNMERRQHPPSSLHTVGELHEMQRAFWNANTIQEFWSGKSWLRSDDGNMLSYELAATFVSLAARDWDAFRLFVNDATLVDAGNDAAGRHLGHGVAAFATSLLGPGPWEPDPPRWLAGVECGQFGPRRR